jgi:hypothetical protein
MNFFEKGGRPTNGMAGPWRMKNFEGVLRAVEFGVQNQIGTLFPQRGHEGDRFLRENQTIVTTLNHEEGRSVGMYAGDG